MIRLMMILVLMAGMVPSRAVAQVDAATVPTKASPTKTLIGDPSSSADASSMSDAGILVDQPETVTGAIKTARSAVAAAKDGRWWYFSALVLMVLMFLLKFIGKRAGFWPKLGRWRYFIPPVLSIVAALLAAFQGGVSIDAAFGVFTSSWVISSAQEAWEHGVLNKPRASALSQAQKQGSGST